MVERFTDANHENGDQLVYFCSCGLVHAYSHNIFDVEGSATNFDPRCTACGSEMVNIEGKTEAEEFADFVENFLKDD